MVLFCLLACCVACVPWPSGLSPGCVDYEVSVDV